VSCQNDPVEPTYRLIDRMDTTGENHLSCSCGARIWPDCDMSRASINQAMDEHVAKAHAVTSLNAVAVIDLDEHDPDEHEDDAYERAREDELEDMQGIWENDQ